MASVPLLPGATRLPVVVARQQSHFTSSCCYSDHCFPKVGGHGHLACNEASGRYLGAHRFEVRRHPRFVACESTKSKKAPAQKEKQPSVLEIQRAIGVLDNDEPNTSVQNGGSSSFMDFLASTPIGQPESSFERKIRETSEWLVEHTESRALRGQKILVIVCMMIFPVWVFLLSVASGVIQLPFKTAFLDDLLS